MAQRGERKSIAGIDVIIDCYNANPSSMRAGLKTFAAMKPQTSDAKKICVIGDMLELGAIESREHIAVGNYLAELMSSHGVIDVIITVGARARLSAEALKESDSESGVEIHSLDNALDAGDLLAEIATVGDVVYLKASRGIALERAMLALKARSQV